jgi:glucose-1-phosphate adenylyltransferase
MLEFHEKMDADVTVAVRDVPLEETDRFGIMTVNDGMQIVEFTEKPPDRDKGTLANMGIYAFKAEVLIERLKSMREEVSELDFGKHVIPSMIGQVSVYAYRFEGYWVDVGTIHAYWETNLEMAQPVPPLDLYNPDWVVHTRDQERPPVKVGPQGRVTNSLISNGCVIRGSVEHSVLSPGVYVSPGAVIRESVVLNDTWIGPGALVDMSILDADVVVGPSAVIGYGDDNMPNQELPDRLDKGITVVGERSRIPGGLRVGRNVLIHSDRTEVDFPDPLIASGGTV